MPVTAVGTSAVHKRALAGLAAAIAAMAAGQILADGSKISQSGEQKDMRRVGHVDLQGRPSYQPNVIVYPDGRTIAFAGTHSSAAPKPNPLNGGALELNGTMIIDVTNPARPVEKFHIPVPAAGGQAQMARMCLGSDLPRFPTRERQRLPCCRRDRRGAGGTVAMVPSQPSPATRHARRRLR